MPTTGQPWTLFLTCGVAAVVLGLLLWLCARFARRRGDDPHCRGCGYALVGIDSDRCPECGRPLSPKNVVRGVRRRRPALVWGGRALVLLGVCAAGLGGYAKARAVDWYQYRPAAWVVDDASAADAAKANRAWAELDRRRAAGTLPAEVEAKLVEAAVAEQSKSPGPTDLPNRKRMIEHLGGRYEAGALTAPQADAFLSRLSRPTLAVRPLVAVGDFVVYRVEQQGESPDAFENWLVRYKELELLLDGVPLKEYGSEDKGRLRSSSTMTRRIKPPAMTPGRRTLQIRYLVETFKRANDNDRRSDGTLVNSRTATMSASFDVDPRPPGEMVKLVDRPDLAGAIRSSVVVERMGAEGPSSQYWMELRVAAPQVNVAFDVFVRGDGREQRLQSIAVPQGKSTRYMIHAEALRSWRSAAVDVVLRSNPAAARETIELFDIWNGEVVVPDVPLVHPQRDSE